MDLMLTGYLRGGYEIAREFWAAQHNQPDFESVWRRSLEKGVWLGEFTPKPPASYPTKVGPAPTSTEGFEIVFRPDPCIWDGSYTNNAFLQELPKPLTKLTWDNAALITQTPPKSSASAATHRGWGTSRNFPHLRVFKRLCQALKSIVNALEKPVSKRMSAATSGNGKGC